MTGRCPDRGPEPCDLPAAHPRRWRETLWLETSGGGGLSDALAGLLEAVADAEASRSWRRFGYCQNVDLFPELRDLRLVSRIFFPDKNDHAAYWVRKAKVICDGCPVQVECLEFGLREKFGVFGGLTERERRVLRRERRAVEVGVVAA